MDRKFCLHIAETCGKIAATMQDMQLETNAEHFLNESLYWQQEARKEKKLRKGNKNV